MGGLMRTATMCSHLTPSCPAQLRRHGRLFRQVRQGGGPDVALQRFLAQLRSRRAACHHCLRRHGAAQEELRLEVQCPPPLYKTGAAQRRPCRPRDCNRLKPLVHLSRAPNWSGPYPRRAAISSTRTASTERWNLLREPGLCTESPALGVCCCVGKIAVVGRGTTRDIIGGAASC